MTDSQLTETDREGKKSRLSRKGLGLFGLRLLAASVSGLLLALAFPPFDFGALIWFWPVPLLTALWWPGSGERKRGVKGALGGFFYGWWLGVVFHLICLHWVREVHDFGWVTLSLFLGLYTGLWGLICATLARPDERKFAVPAPGGRNMGGVGESLRSAFFVAAAWTGLEWLRGMIFTGFGWNTLGIALLGGGGMPLVQAADLIGAVGLSFPILFCAAAGVNSLRRLVIELRAGRMRTRIDFLAAVALVMGLVVYGVMRVAKFSPESNHVTAGVVQPNIPLIMRGDPARGDEIRGILAMLSDRVADKTELLIWPESAMPDYFNTPENQWLIDQTRSRGDFAFLAGVDLLEPSGDVENPLLYNGSVFYAPGSNQPEFYRKGHLVPFGEYVPLRSLFEKIYPPLVDLVPGDFDRGTDTEPIRWEAKGVDLVPLICFEDTIGRYARRFARDRAQVLVNITNDSWFHESIESVQHLRNAVLRCVELRRPMVRAANTGVSCVITATGAISRNADGTETVLRNAQGSTFLRGAARMRVPIPKDHPVTLYARWGDSFSVILLACCGVFLLARIFGFGKRSRDATAG